MILKHGKNWIRITRVIHHEDTQTFILKCRETTIGIISQQSPNWQRINRVIQGWNCKRLTYLVRSFNPV